VPGPQADHVADRPRGHQSPPPLSASRAARLASIKDDDTAPLPVIRAPIVPAEPGRGPAREQRPVPEPRRAPGPGAHRRPQHEHQQISAEPPLVPLPLPSVPPAPAQARLDQIKDLYLTAEAIGEDALVRHFEEVSLRQRALIREYFEQAGVAPKSAARILGADRPAHQREVSVIGSRKPELSW
jgi:hypothetical protein